MKQENYNMKHKLDSKHTTKPKHDWIPTGNKFERRCLKCGMIIVKYSNITTFYLDNKEVSNAEGCNNKINL